MNTWMIWLIAAALLLVIELLSGTVACLCFAIGCVVSVIPAALGLGFVWQVSVFAVATILCFLFLRPAILRSSLHKKGHHMSTNMDALIGRVGKVTHEVTNYADDKGRVQIDGDNWLAFTSDPDVPIERGTQVVVESYDSLIIKVRRK